ncbi:ABC transporter substrate-binding protein [Desulfatitalea alkaliphila]|uniref:ABC transport system substrate-binding protein n=1 Tax=Desulfatitalea alkaliphila TaxID=2929485 RepID=A0AA41R1Q6_9BACT|nr:ABC transporter substrate binding protein [Desulfatitalea alkaliphila]MCJ8499190.1 hypothetical protein [Desulfatitalea alkaliphila]
MHSKQRVYGLWICLLSLMVMCTVNVAAANKVVVVVGVGNTSYQNIGSIEPIIQGIQDGLKTKRITPEIQFTELVGLGSDGARAAVGSAAIARAKVSNPDLIITLTDDCLKFVGSRIDDIPVVFTFIANMPEALGLPKKNVTGVLFRSYAPDTFGLARKLMGVSSVTFFTKDSPAMQASAGLLRANAGALEQGTGVRLVDAHLLETFRDWVDATKKTTTGMIYLGDTSRIDRNGYPVSDRELVHWTVRNATVPVIGAAEKDVEAGALFAVVPSGRAMGLLTANTALKVLGGASPADLSYTTNTQGELVVNISTARRYNLVLPEALLASARIYE